MKLATGDRMAGQTKALRCAIATGLAKTGLANTPLKMLPAIAAASLVALGSGVASAQEIDNTQTLPDAKAGECYAKVIVPAKFSTQQETVVLQEASERIEVIPAKYESAEQTIVLKESTQQITTVPAVFEESSERVEVSPASSSWVASGGKAIPASPSALDGVSRSGVNLSSAPIGTCFREYFTPASFKTQTQQVLVKPSSERISVIPAKYETVEERVVVKESATQVVDVPPTYRTEKQQVLVEPAKTVWKQGRGLIEKIDNVTGEILCLVEIPARFQTVNRTVLERPASTKTIEIPAVYKTVKVQRLLQPATEQRVAVSAEFSEVTIRAKAADASFFWLKKGESASDGSKYTGNEICHVGKPAEYRTIKTQNLKTPATTRIIDVPAQFDTIKVSRLLTPATERRIPIPQKTQVITKRVQIEPSRLEWRAVLCETNTTPTIITDLQRALKSEGFDPGDIDGIIGSSTKQAIEEYQLKNNLDRGGITYQTLKALGLP